jgi:hypothetical protein
MRAFIASPEAAAAEQMQQAGMVHPEGGLK